MTSLDVAMGIILAILAIKYLILSGRATTMAVVLCRVQQRGPKYPIKGTYTHLTNMMPKSIIRLRYV